MPGIYSCLTSARKSSMFCNIFVFNISAITCHINNMTHDVSLTNGKGRLTGGAYDLGGFWPGESVYGERASDRGV